MRSADRQSWRFTWDVPTNLHRLLYARAALRLEAYGGSRVVLPPPTSELLANRSALIAASDRLQAASDWLEWWERAVSMESAVKRPTEEGSEAWRGKVASYRYVWRPPMQVPRSSPLATAWALLEPEADRWAAIVRRSLSPPRSKLFTPDVIRGCAERVATAYGADLGAVHGSAVVLAVGGTWWRMSAVGEVVCSAEAAQDARSATQLVTTLFESVLA